MDNPIHNEADLKEREYENSFDPNGDGETNEGTSTAIKDPDRILCMIVLLLTCLGLAALAHVLV